MEGAITVTHVKTNFHIFFLTDLIIMKFVLPILIDNLLISHHFLTLASSEHDETQRGLTGSISKECGVFYPAFLSYFYFAPDGE